MTGRLRVAVNDRMRVVARDGRIVRLKVCLGCGRELECGPDDATDFFVNRKGPDGRPLWWDARCKPCARARKRARVAAMSPLEVEQRKQYWRDYGSSRRARRERRRLPIEPFARWLEAYMLAAHHPNGEAVAFDLGLISRRVRSFLARAQPTVSYETVDRALLAASRFVDVDGRTIFTITDLYAEYFGVGQKAA